MRTNKRETLRNIKAVPLCENELVLGRRRSSAEVRSNITLLTMVSAQESYAKLSLRALSQNSTPPDTGERRDLSPLNAMRRHLYDKYGYAAVSDSTIKTKALTPPPPARPRPKAVG